MERLLVGGEVQMVAYTWLCAASARAWDDGSVFENMRLKLPPDSDSLPK